MSEQFKPVKLESVRIELQTIAIEQKTHALAASQKITVVSDGRTEVEAVNTAGIIKGLIKQMENSRKSAKEPFLRLGQTIDTQAKQYTDELNLELARLNRLIADHQTAKFKAAEEERRRVEFEQRAAREAEQKRIAELQAEIERNKEAENKAKLEELNRQLQKEQIKAEIRQEEETPVAPTEKPKVAGASVSFTYDFEVEDIHALYKAHPQCVKMEVKKLAVQDLIKSGIKEIPGVRVFETTKVATKAISPTQLLE